MRKSFRMKQILGILLAVIMVLGMPTAVLAEPEADEDTHDYETMAEASVGESGLIVEDDAPEEEETIAGGNLDEPEALLEDYIQVLTAEIAEEYETVSAPALDGIVVNNLRGSRLTGAEKKAYDLLKEKIESVASGSISNTEFSLSFAQLFPETYNKGFSASELGVEHIVANNSITDEAKNALLNMFKVDTSKVHKALLYDCPYELYWYNKTNGNGTRIERNARLTVTYESGELKLYLKDDANFVFKMKVANAYASGAYQTNTETISQISTAVKNAAEIVDSCASMSDYEKLKHYKDTICGLVTYNDSAAGDGVAYGDPWQLIYVFDEYGKTNEDGTQKADTNVVCEGYSKAFKYLCDLSEFRNKSLTGYLMTGIMAGGEGAGNHMWNLVSIDGRNYLTDITNCDSGTIGHSDNEGVPDKLFLRGNEDGPSSYEVQLLDEEGKPAGSYTSEQYVFSDLNNMYYVYDEDILDMFTEEERTLATADYIPSGAELVDISSASISGIEAEYSYNGVAITPDPVVTMETGGGTVTLAEGSDYTVAYQNNIAVGNATVVISGIGNYCGSIDRTFQIVPQEIAIPTPVIGLVYNGTEQTGVSATAGCTVENGAATDAGDYTATVTLADKTNSVWEADETTGDKEISWSIAPASIVDAEISGIVDKVYAGSAVTQDIGVKVTLDGQQIELTEGTDFSVSYQNNSEIGEATVTISGIGNYDGSIDRTFQITSQSILQRIVIPTPMSGLVYNGTEQTGVSATAGCTVENGAATDAGDYTATVTLADKANSVWEADETTGDKEISWSIAPASIVDAEISGIVDKVYAGSAITQDIGVKAMLGDKQVELVEGSDFRVDYQNNTNVGTATVTIIGIGNFTGSREVTFSITRRRVARPSARNNLTYNGTLQTGVNAGAEYTVTGGSAANVGSYKATASLKDKSNYAWSDGTTVDQTIDWRINAKKITPAITLSSTAFTYDGKIKTPTVTVKDGGMKLAASQYTVSWPSGRKNVGTYNVKITLKGNYSGTKTVSFAIKKAANPLKIKAKTATVKHSKVKKKAQTLAISKLITFGNKGQGKLTYTKASGNKMISINKNNGKVTVKKGLKKGTYKVKIKVCAAGNGNYNAVTRTITVAVKVK